MNFEGSRIIVTGSSGFVGKYLISKLLESGGEVFGIDRWKTNKKNLKEGLDDDILQHFNTVSGNLHDISSLANIINSSEPEYVFHLAAQSYVPESFVNPLNTIETNVQGTCNLLEAIRNSKSDPSIVFAGSSEEYGLVLYSEKQVEDVRKKHSVIFPEPASLPELPITEENPLRPMSPYAASKVSADYVMRNYNSSYGLKTVVSRAFNHEGAGRGDHFVTSQITRQVMQLKHKEREYLEIGNVLALRDWSHVRDIVNGYMLLAVSGKPGGVYNQGSQRTNSVLTYILLSLNEAGMVPSRITTMRGGISIDDPAEFNEEEVFGLKFPLSLIDKMILDGQLNLTLNHEGLIIDTSNGKVNVVFDPVRFRPSEVPILLSSCKKIKGLGFDVTHSLKDIVVDQLNHYLDPRKRM